MEELINEGKRMKKNLLSIGLMLSLFSCSVPDYEKAVSDWVQAETQGKFEMLEVLQTSDITVSDSLSILKKQFDMQKEKTISILEKDIDNSKTKLSFAKFAGADLTDYEKHINKIESQLDSVNNTSFHSIYDNRKAEEVLVKVLKCRYALTTSGRKEMSGEFILSPDMKYCYGKLGVK